MDEGKLRRLTGFVLWTISGLMGMGLYLGFAGTGWISIAVAVALSGSLEAGKILSFRRKGIQFKTLAVCLSGLTLTGVLGSTLMTVEARRHNSLQTRIEALQSRRDYQDLLGQEKAIKAQGDDLQARIAGLPVDWVSAAMKATAELGVLRQRQQDFSSELTHLENGATADASPESPTIFGAIARVVSLDEGNVEIGVLLILAALVELTAFSLAGHQDLRAEANLIGRTARSSESQTKPTSLPSSAPPQSVPRPLAVTPDSYLSAALDHPKKPYLLGRGKVSERLGITETQAKEFIEALVRQGKVKRESKYFVAT